MKVKSFGCSFIYGTDLPDCAPDSCDQPSRLTWPALLAQNLNADYRCYARPGIGNLRIAQSVLAELANKDDAVYVIQWTWIDRFDWTGNDDEWHTILPNDQGSIGKFYYRDLHSQFRDKLTSLMCISTVLDALDRSNQQYVMTYVDDLLWESDFHTDSAMELLQQRIDPAVADFSGMGFLDWAKQNGFDISPNYHPDARAHAQACQLVLSGVDKYRNRSSLCNSQKTSA